MMADKANSKIAEAENIIWQAQRLSNYEKAQRK